jgi:uncharacterized C2H2 Zn-finger protein
MVIYRKFEIQFCHVNHRDGENIYQYPYLNPSCASSYAKASEDKKAPADRLPHDGEDFLNLPRCGGDVWKSEGDVKIEKFHKTIMKELK